MTGRTRRILRVIDILLLVLIVGGFVWLCVLSSEGQTSVENSSRTTTIVLIAWMAVIIGIGIPFMFLCFHYKYETVSVVILEFASLIGRVYY